MAKAGKATSKRLNPKRTGRVLLLRKQQAIAPLIIIAVGLVGTTHFGLQVFAMPEPTTNPQTQQQAQAPAPVKKFMPRSNAVRLQIPAIALDTEVVTTGKATDGSIEVPYNYRIAGLYRFGPTPGEMGPAVIVGHVSNIRGPGVFRYLHKLQPGQIIKVKREDGRVATFKIDKVRDFPQNKFPTKEVYSNLNYAGLRLITCGGSFSVASQRYDKNTIVFASLLN